MLSDLERKNTANKDKYIGKREKSIRRIREQLIGLFFGTDIDTSIITYSYDIFKKIAF